MAVVGKTIREVVAGVVKSECSAAVQTAPSLDAVKEAVSQAVAPAVAAAVGSDSFKTSMKGALGAMLGAMLEEKEKKLSAYLHNSLNETAGWILDNVVKRM